MRALRSSLLSLSTIAAAVFALSTSGCTAVFGGQNDTNVTFPLDRKPDSTFWAWNEITVSQDINSVTSATLLGVTLKIDAPAGADFSFLQSLKGETVTPTGRTTVVTLDEIPKGAQFVVMKVQYSGDLHPLFKDNHTIRIEWTGATNPAFAPWPEGGFTVNADIQIDVE